MNLREGDTVVRTGTYLYDGTVLGDLRIVRTNVRSGSGDNLDEPWFLDDLPEPWGPTIHPGPWFDVVYTPAGERGRFRTCVPGYRSLEAAVASVEKRFTGVVWGD
ncbi:MAG: hypothetical protein K1X89_13605 [Myxococcaceae bacterium]|nr:hypothetical protein [Myxococcaceae bacterium]